MKPIFWKEWRENYGWALLGAGVMVLACLYTLSRSDYSQSNWHSTWNDNFPLPFTLLAPILAASLGFLQTMRELKRDQWAFLVHRPVPRSSIFYGKAGAGIALYLLATLLPLFIIGWWLSLPGRVAGPFFWALLLPAIAGVLAGIPLYLGAIVTAMRTARWFGSRALALPAALLCNLLVIGVGEFWQACLLVVFFTLLLGTAALSTFITRGNYHSQNRLGRLSLGTILYLGSAIVCLGIAVFVVNALQTQHTYLSQSQYELDPKGQVRRVTFRGGLIENVTDLAGRKIPLPAGKSQWQLDYFLQGANVYFRTIKSTHSYSYRDLRRFATPMDQYNYPTGFWYYIPQERLIYGYNEQTKRLAVVAGSNGFQSTQNPNPQPFPDEAVGVSGWPEDNNVLAFTNGIFRLEPQNRRVVRLFSAPLGERIRVAAVAQFPIRLGQNLPKTILVSTEQKVYLLNPQGKKLSTIPFDPQKIARKSTYVTLYDTGKESLLWYREAPTRVVYGKPLHTTLVTFSRQNQVIKQEQITLSGQPTTKTDTTYMPSAAFMPTGLAVGLGVAFLGGKAFGSQTFARILTSLLTDISTSVLFLSYMLVGALISAILCWKIAERCVLSPTGKSKWAIGGFVLGPFGVLMLLGLLEWPSREKCANCGNQRVVTRENCEHCGANWPEPAQDGTEIFTDTSNLERSLTAG